MILRTSRLLTLVASLALPALGLTTGGCAAAPVETAGDSADAVKAGDVLDGIPRNTWVSQGASSGRHEDETGVAVWDVYVAFGAKSEPYVIALGKAAGKDAPIVEVVVDVTNGEMDLRSGLEMTAEARDLWLESIAADLQSIEGERTSRGGLATQAEKSDACAIATAWAVLHAAGFAASGALTVGACTVGAVSGPVSGGLTLAFCIWQASDTVDLAAETGNRIATAYKSCRRPR